MQQNKEYVVINLMKIFLTPPNNKKEKITVLAVMVITFIIFFGPLCFSDMHPVRALVPSAAFNGTTSDKVIFGLIFRIIYIIALFLSLC